LHVTFQNIQSIGNKLHLIEHLLLNSNIDILLLSEIWKTTNYVNTIVIPGYRIGSLYCRQHYGGGGVCLFVRDNIDFIERKDIVDYSVEFIIEICAIEIPKLNLILIGLYRADRHIDNFYQQINRMLKVLNSKYKKKYVVIGGDFNINIQVKNKQSQELNNTLKSFNYTQLIRNATRVTKTTSSCIDLIFTNYPKLIKESYVVDYGLSDHKAVQIKLNSELDCRNNSTLYKYNRLFTNKKINTFKNSLKRLKWDKIIDKNKNLDSNYNSFITTIKNILNKYIPVQKLKINITQKTRGLQLV
jgi:hypothetical protein